MSNFITPSWMEMNFAKLWASRIDEEGQWSILHSGGEFYKINHCLYGELHTSNAHPPCGRTAMTTVQEVGRDEVPCIPGPPSLRRSDETSRLRGAARIELEPQEGRRSPCGMERQNEWQNPRAGQDHCTRLSLPSGTSLKSPGSHTDSGSKADLQEALLTSYGKSER